MRKPWLEIMRLLGQQKYVLKISREGVRFPKYLIVTHFVFFLIVFIHTGTNLVLQKSVFFSFLFLGEDPDDLKKNWPSSMEMITLSSDESNDGAAMTYINPAMEDQLFSTHQGKIHDKDRDKPKNEQIKGKTESCESLLPANINFNSERISNTHFLNASHSREDQSHQPVAGKFSFQQHMTSHPPNSNRFLRSILKPAINAERGKVSVPSTLSIKHGNARLLTQSPNTRTADYPKQKNERRVTFVTSSNLSEKSKHDSSCFSSRLSRETNQAGKSQVLENKGCHNSESSQTTYNAFLTPKSQSGQLEKICPTERDMCGSESATSSALYQTITNPGISRNKRSKNAKPNIINQTPIQSETRDGLNSILTPLEIPASPRKSNNDKDLLSLQNEFKKSATSIDVQRETNPAVKLQNMALRSFTLQQIKELAILGLKTLTISDSEPHHLEEFKKPSGKTKAILSTSARREYMQNCNTLSKGPENRSLTLTPIFNRGNFIPRRRKSTCPSNETKIPSYGSTLPRDLNSIAGNSLDSDMAEANKEVNDTYFSANFWNISNPYLQGNTNPSMPKMNIDFPHSDSRNCSGVNLNQKPDGYSQCLKSSTIHDTDFNSTPKNTNSFNPGINSSSNPSYAFPSNPMKTCSKESSGMTIPINENPETSQVWSGINRRNTPEINPQYGIWRSWEPTAQVQPVNIPEEDMVTDGTDFPLLNDHTLKRSQNVRITNAPSHIAQVTKTADTASYSCDNRHNSSNNSFGNFEQFNLRNTVKSQGSKNVLGLKAPAEDHNPTSTKKYLPQLKNIRQGLFKPLKYASETHPVKAKNIQPPYYALLQSEVERNCSTEPPKKKAKIAFPDIPNTPRK